MGNSSSTRRSSKKHLSKSSSSLNTAARYYNYDSPPSYSAVPPKGLLPQHEAEDALLTIRNYNVVFVIDDSASMNGIGPNGKLWTEAQDALATLAEQAQRYDTDGIDVYFFNNPKVGSGLRGSKSVTDLFNSVRPSGMTPMAGRLETLLLDYLSKLEKARDTKPINYIVLTDGVPTDEPESVIVAAARRLDKGNFPMTQVGIQFVQIGNDLKATKFLTELDNDLKQHHDVRDIVDTTPYDGAQLNAEVLTKILLGGINRRVDRRGGGSVL